VVVNNNGEQGNRKKIRWGYAQRRRKDRDVQKRVKMGKTKGEDHQTSEA
jgi:hypothetical protein